MVGFSIVILVFGGVNWFLVETKATKIAAKSKYTPNFSNLETISFLGIDFIC